MNSVVTYYDNIHTKMIKVRVLQLLTAKQRITCLAVEQNGYQFEVAKLTSEGKK